MLGIVSNLYPCDSALSNSGIKQSEMGGQSKSLLDFQKESWKLNGLLASFLFSETLKNVAS